MPDLSEKEGIKYFFRFISATRLAGSSFSAHQLNEENAIKVNYPTEGIELMIFDKRVSRGGIFLHHGLGLDVEVLSDDKDEARVRAEIKVLNMLAILSYLESCYSGNPFEILSYKKTENKHLLEDYRAIAVDEGQLSIETSIRIILMQRVDHFIKKTLLLSAETRYTLDLCLHWYWRALGANDIKDRFINLWLSLEFLEQPLKKHFGISTGRVKKSPSCPICEKTLTIKCPHCNSDYYYEGELGRAGTKMIEASIKEKIMKFSDLYSFRSKLFHPSTRGMAAEKKEYEEAIFSIRFFLNHAIVTILGIDPSEVTSLASSEIRTKSLPDLFQFNGTIIVTDQPKVDDPESQPSVSGVYSYAYEVDAKDELVTNYDVMHTFAGVFQSGKLSKTLKVDSSRNVIEVWERKE